MAGKEDERSAFCGQRGLLNRLLQRLLVVVMVRSRHVAGQVKEHVPFVIKGAVDDGPVGLPTPEPFAQVFEVILRPAALRR